MWLTGSWCSDWVSGLRLGGGRAEFSTLVYQRPPQPHVIPNGESSPRDLHLNAKTQLHSTTSKLQCWTPHTKQLARQEHNTTPLAESLPKIILSSQTPQNTPPDMVLPTRKKTSSLIHQNTGTSPLHQEAYTSH